MALMKRKISDDIPYERRNNVRSVDDLLAQLDEPDASVRRKAARDLRQQRGVAHQLVAHLRKESSPSVRAALFDALAENPDNETAQALISLLHSEDAGLRNGAVETLHLIPDLIGPHMQRLLADDDSDIRLFALDILRTLPHRDAPSWLLEVIRNDDHVNVVSVAVDRLADLGDCSMADDLLALKQRFASEPFIGFSVDSALSRLEA